MATYILSVRVKNKIACDIEHTGSLLKDCHCDGTANGHREGSVDIKIDDTRATQSPRITNRIIERIASNVIRSWRINNVSSTPHSYSAMTRRNSHSQTGCVEWFVCCIDKICHRNVTRCVLENTDIPNRTLKK